MAALKQAILSYIRDEEGASAAEYAVLVAVVVGVVLIGVRSYNLTGIFTAVNAKVVGCVNAAAGATSC